MITTLADYGIISVSGADARSFLHGQLTCDVAALSCVRSQIGALCNPQGRVLGVMRLVELGEAILLLLPRDIARHIANHLRRFVLRARVELEEGSAETAILGITGSDIRQIEDQLDLSAPETPNAVTGTADYCLIREQGATSRWLLVGRVAGLVDRLSNTHERREWRHLDIVEGLPSVTRETQEAFVAQMLNLDLVEGISFTKGCYTGQEIIARTQNLGTIKRRMLRFAAPVDRTVGPGDEIRGDGQNAGQIVTAVDVEGGCELLAVVKLDMLDRVLTLADGAALSQLPLPYPIPELQRI